MSVWKASTVREDLKGRMSCATALEIERRANEQRRDAVGSRSEGGGAMVADTVSANGGTSTT
jgi:hypothetical protein